VNLDYDIENVPTNDPSQGNGNYVVAMDLISYSNANFQKDAAIVDILNPNNYEYYKKFNPSCSFPKVILQNTGALPITECVIRIYVSPEKIIDYEWTGNLTFLKKEIIEIPINDISWWNSVLPGTQTFHAEIISINGSTASDENTNKNIKI